MRDCHWRIVCREHINGCYYFAEVLSSLLTKKLVLCPAVLDITELVKGQRAIL